MEATSNPSPQKESLLKKLSPKQKAVVSLLENIDNMEKSTAESEMRARAKWSKGGTTGDLLRKAFEYQDPYYLPLPSGNNPYEAFGFTIKYQPTEKDNKLSPQESMQKRRQFPNKGSFDMRIYDTEDSLKLLANGDSLESMKDEWVSLIGDIAYPIIVQDRNGFSYSNLALEALRK